MRTSFAAIALSGALALGLQSAPAATKPNFIFILADDMGYGDIEPFGSVKNHTPHLDRMAEEGIKLTSFYAAPVCTPSRAQVLTGCYAKRVSLPHVLGPAAPIGLSSHEHSIAELLKQQGYATIAIGKWHVGDAPEFLPTHHGFDSYLGLPYSNDMGGPTNLTRARRDRRPPLPLIENDHVLETVTPEGQNQLTKRYTEEAVKFIREHKETPFFLYLPHMAVHVPIHPGDQFRGKSPHGWYSDWVEEVDWSVGQVLDTVRSLGLSERTLVVFSSDNGPWLKQGTNSGVAGPLRGGKGGTYEGGVREPTLAWWPGHVPAGKVVDAVAANFDLLPTFVDLAGGTVPTDHPIDGRDISGLLLGKTKESPHEAYYYFSGNNLQAVRSGPWKLAIAPQSEGLGQPPTTSKKDFTRTLYNLQTDTGERTNVAALHPEIVQRLQGLVEKMDADLGITREGPGVRPPGRVSHPVGLWLPGQAPSADELAAHYDIEKLDQLGIGDSLSPEAAPQIARKPLFISVEVEPKSDSGVIVAQGGSARGYTLFLREGKPVFAVREHDRLVSATAPEAPRGHFLLEARLAKGGAMTLSVDGKIVATGQTAGLITGQPQEDFCVGHDNGRPVADYDGKALFQGKLAHLKVITE